jgi:hypothetical protein
LAFGFFFPSLLSHYLNISTTYSSCSWLLAFGFWLLLPISSFSLSQHLNYLFFLLLAFGLWLLAIGFLPFLSQHLIILSRPSRVYLIISPILPLTPSPLLPFVISSAQNLIISTTY